MSIRRRWDIQISPSPWFSLGIHFDHTDPSFALRLPGLIVYVGRCKQPGLRTPPVLILDRCGICKRPLDEPVEASRYWRCPSCVRRAGESR